VSPPEPDPADGTSPLNGAGPAPGEDVWKRRLRKSVGPALGLLVVIGIFVAVIPRITSYQAVLDAALALSWEDWLVILASVAANVATSGPPWMAAVPGLSYGRAMLMTQTTTLVTTVLPLGEAVGIATQVKMLSDWRFRAHAITAGLVLVTIWNQTVNVAIPIFSIAALGPSKGNRYLLVVSALAAVALVAIIGALVYAMRGDAAAEHLGDLAGRVVSALARPLRRGPFTDWGPRLVTQRRETIDVVSGRWHWLTLATLCNQLTLFGVLLACLDSMGLHGISTLEALAAWSFTRLLASVPITPGGLGVTELGMTAALVGFGGGRTPVVTAVLLYRILTFVPTIVVGSICALIWRYQERRPKLREPVPEDG
jgi:putative heme transporter